MKSNNDEAHNRRSSRRGEPLEMLDGQCPRVVETREPATETTLEDVLAGNLSIRSTARTRLLGFYQLPVRIVTRYSTLS